MTTTHGKIFELYTGGGGGGGGRGGGSGRTADTVVKSYIEDNLSIRTIEKNKYGEVFTPYSYICELLDQLPARVWGDPALRWLEPAAGIGHFCVVIYIRLMDGLTAVFPDLLARHEHILRNMLFMVEINAANVERTRELFGSFANIRCADFLDRAGVLLLAPPTHKGGDIDIDIDVIIGNPPFQMPRDDTIRMGSKGGRTLWDRFIVKSLERLKTNLSKKDKYLCFITPPAWRKPKSPHGLWTMMTRDSCSLRYLHMIDKKTAIRDLQVQQRMDLYVISVRSAGDSDSDSDEDRCLIIESSGLRHHNTIDPREWPFLPNSEFNYIKDILDPTGPDPGRVIYDRSAYGSDLPHMSPDYIAGEFIHPVVHTMTKRGIGLWYSNTATRGGGGHFGKSKVILNFNEKLYPYLDYAGEYGMGQFSFGLPVGSVAEGEAMVRALTSPQFQAVVRATKWGAYQTDRQMFEYFREGWWNAEADADAENTSSSVE